MPFTTLPITYGLPRRLTDDRRFLVEQAPWAGGVGMVTKLNLVHYLGHALYGDEEETVDCGIDGGRYTSALHVYPFVVGTSYEAALSHGELGDGVDQEVEVRELVSFSLENEARVKYPIRTLRSAQWATTPWDETGAETSAPAIDVDGQIVRLAKKVYGSVVLTYRTFRHQHRLRVPPRDDAMEGHAYDSHALVWWDGGCELLALDPPEGAEEDFADDTDCYGGGGGRIIPPQPGPPPVGYPEDRTVTINYCTQDEDQ